MKKIVFIFLFVCFFVMHWKTDVFAEVEVNEDPFSAVSSFQVASLFYKLSSAEPNFKKWAMEAEAYKQAPDFDKEIILSQEENRLREQFANINHKSLINIYFNVKLDQYSTMQERFFFPEINKETFLPYSYMGENYAILLAGIERFGDVYVPREVAGRIEGQSVKAEFTVLPIKAENKHPIMIYDENRWVIVGSIAEFKLWNHNRTTLYFSERAEWYNPKNKLLELFKE